MPCTHLISLPNLLKLFFSPGLAVDILAEGREEKGGGRGERNRLDCRAAQYLCSKGAQAHSYWTL